MLVPRTPLTLVGFLVVALPGPGCGWNSSCERFYIFEDTSCGEPLSPAPSLAALTPCAAWTLPCADETSCLPSNLGPAQGESLCTRRCDADADCAGLPRPARCAGAPGAGLCHAACGSDADCAPVERCVPAGVGAARVCAPLPRAYGACSLEGQACGSGLACSVEPDTGAMCTRRGCAGADDCPEQLAQQAVCVRSTRGSFCAPWCYADADCRGRGTRCVHDGDLSIRDDFGLNIGACLAR
ncbi:MAG: hypothetical protein JWM10_5331 [Myxococcaceae bacterium]|nr:hypothetical protein [Myxococcaceae bacterium]